MISRIMPLAAVMGLGLLANAAVGQSSTANGGRPVRLNQVQVIGTHNSYHAGLEPGIARLMQQLDPQTFATLDYSHGDLTAQLDHGIRQIELDVFADSKGGLYAHPYGLDMVAKAGLSAEDPPFDPDGNMRRPGFKVMHVQDIDFISNCQPFTACLEQVRTWSLSHPRHIPLFILIETKQSVATHEIPLVTPEPFTETVLDALDAAILSVFPRTEILTPDDVRGHHATLEEAILKHGWPTLDASRGKVVFLMDQEDVSAPYLAHHPALRGRILFTHSEPGHPDAAFVERKDPFSADIPALVEKGYLVRTRADEETTEARNNDVRRRDAALAGGAQMVSTDYPYFEPSRWTGYSVSLPAHEAARCNPLLVRAPLGDRPSLHGGASPAGRESRHAPASCTEVAEASRVAPSAADAPAVPEPTHNSAAVYPFLGVDWGGNTFVGAALPFGMVKVGPDMQSYDGMPSSFGYMSGGTISGFSHLHLSGASGKYGNILVMPTTGTLAVDRIQSPRIEEINHPGYYAATLTRYGVRVELTATRRAAMHRYTFTAEGPAHLTVDVAHILNAGSDQEGQHFLGGEIQALSNREIAGYGRYAGGWNRGGEYRVYFDMVLDTPAASVQTWTGGGLSGSPSARVMSDQPLGASFNLEARAQQIVLAKVGISFVGTDQARANTTTEIPTWNFDALHSAATAAWDKALSVVELHDASSIQRLKLYTALYHTLLMPADRTGENPDWSTSYPDHPYYDDYYAIWDTFRSSAPLLTLIAPDRERDLLRSLIDIYRHTGYMPDARSGNANGRTQGGSNADVMVADAFVKGLEGIDYGTALQAMFKDASVPPADPQKEGRGGILDYNGKGYVTNADERSGSRTVEYAYDDFAIAEVACGLGDGTAAKTFAQRAENWQNLWDKDLVLEGFKGFLRPRGADGSFAAPYFLERGSWPDFLYEGNLWTYSYYAPQDVRKLIALAGGGQVFTQRLAHVFLKEHFDMSNEPGFLMPVMFNWVNRPDLTAEAVTLLLEKGFGEGRAGLPGNDDSGAMSSWFLFNSIGFYPNAGQAIYLIGTPGYPDVTLSVGHDKTLHIIARNFDPEHVNRYVQSVTLNGRPLLNNWFTHDEIAGGGTLIFTLGSAPGSWGRATPPPSLSDEHASLCSAATPGAGFD